MGLWRYPCRLFPFTLSLSGVDDEEFDLMDICEEMNDFGRLDCFDIPITDLLTLNILGV